MLRTLFLIAACGVLNTLVSAQSVSGPPELIGHWPLQDDAADHSPSKLGSTPVSVGFADDGPTTQLRRAARFDGQSSVITVDESPALKIGRDRFSVAAWVRTNQQVDDVPGDLISQYDGSTRTGFHLGVYTHGGVTNSQSNIRQLHFGIDQDQREPKFTDHGRLGTAVYIFSLCVHNSQLYASTCHAGAGESGRVFRYQSGDQWTDLGSPDQANAVTAMTVFDGSLFVATGKYRLAGSSLAESENAAFGGKVYRLGPDDKWISCGTLSEETQAVASLIEFNGSLYAGSLYKPAGFFRYDGGEKWTPCTTPDGKRVEAMTVFNGSLYATCYDEALVFRYDGDKWETVGRIPDATQTYGLAVHDGSLYVSEWPQAHVYRYIGGTSWEDAGRLGGELEAMPLLVYNGRMYGGTLPLGEVYRFDGGRSWTRIDQVDRTPDVKFRRAWSMAVFQGRLFVGTLPSGRVVSIEAGRNVTHDRVLTPEWHHVAAVRDTDRLRLYVDGQQVSQSAAFEPGSYDLNCAKPMKIGFGAQDYFQGELADVRLYRGVLSESQVQNLAAK